MFLDFLLLLTPLVVTIITASSFFPCIFGKKSRETERRIGSRAAFVSSLGALSVALAGLVRVWASDPYALIMFPSTKHGQQVRRSAFLRSRMPGGICIWRDTLVATKSYGVTYFALLSALGTLKVLRSICRCNILRRVHNSTGTVLATVGLPCILYYFLCFRQDKTTIEAPAFIISAVVPFMAAVSGLADKIIRTATLGLVDNRVVPVLILTLSAMSAAQDGNGAGVLACIGLFLHMCVAGRKRHRDSTLPQAISAMSNYLLIIAMLQSNAPKRQYSTPFNGFRYS